MAPFVSTPCSLTGLMFPANQQIAVPSQWPPCSPRITVKHKKKKKSVSLTPTKLSPAGYLCLSLSTGSHQLLRIPYLFMVPSVCSLLSLSCTGPECAISSGSGVTHYHNQLARTQLELPQLCYRTTISLSSFVDNTLAFLFPTLSLLPIAPCK